MTEQQKKAVKEASYKVKYPRGKWIVPNDADRKLFIKGAQEVIEHPEKYGLKPIEE